MINRIKTLLLIIFLCLMIASCASLRKAVSEVTPEQQTQMQVQVAATAGPFIPTPYQIPATALAGWLACIAYNWFKEKTKPKV